MKKYDLTQKYDSKQSYSLEDLEAVLLNESNKYWQAEEINSLSESNNILYKFKNNKNSGIIDKLNDLFDFDIEKVAKKSNKQTFEMLKVLKYLYYLDKHDRIKNMKKLTDKEFVFLDMLAKPRLENFNTRLMAKSSYGAFLDDVIRELKLAVPNGRKYERIMFKINMSWQGLISSLSQYVLTGNSFRFPEISLRELRRIKNLLNDKVYSKLKTLTPQKTSSKKVLDTFFNIVVSHTYMCSVHDNLVINNSYSIPDTPSNELVELNKSFDEVATEWSILELSKQFLKTEQADDPVKIIFKMVLNSGEVTKKFRTDYELALKYAKLVATWFENYVTDSDFKSEIPVPYLVAIMQEIIFHNNNKTKIKNDFFRYKNAEKTLTSALKHPDKTNAIVILAWQKCIENRVVSNLGQVELIKEKREIENIIYKIKEFVFSIRNLKDMELVNEYLFNIAAEIVYSDFAISFFEKEFLKRISDKVINKSFVIDKASDFENMASFLKILKIDELQNVENVIEFVTKRINELCAKHSNDIIFENYCFQTSTYKVKREFKIYFKINFKEKYVHFIDFEEVFDHKKDKKLIKFGLK